MANNSPVILLIRPQMGENIGAVARAMANFGFSELRIVAPRDGWPNPQAEAMATNALPILQAAQIFPDTLSAMKDITRAYATTARPREVEKRVIEPQEAMREIIGLLDDRMTKDQSSNHPVIESSRAALVFGPERTGLTNEDLSWCDTIITIPTSEHSSLNIAQSMVVLGYVYLSRAKRSEAEGSPSTGGRSFNSPATSAGFAQDKVQAAPLEQYDHLFCKLEQYLDEAAFFKAPEKKPGMWLNIKTMLLRGRFTEQEIRTMHGIFRAIAGE